MFKTIIKLLPAILISTHNSKQSKNMNTHQNFPKNINNRNGFWANLVKDDNNFSTVNFFLVASTIVGILLLIVPIVGISVDLYFNHTISFNMSDMATYIMSVSGIFAAAGLTNAWTEYSYQKYNKNIFENSNNNSI